MAVLGLGLVFGGAFGLRRLVVDLVRRCLRHIFNRSGQNVLFRHGVLCVDIRRLANAQAFDDCVAVSVDRVDTALLDLRTVQRILHNNVGVRHVALIGHGDRIIDLVVQLIGFVLERFLENGHADIHRHSLNRFIVLTARLLLLSIGERHFISLRSSQIDVLTRLDVVRSHHMTRDEFLRAAHPKLFNGLVQTRQLVGYLDVLVGDVANVGHSDLVEDLIAQFVGILGVIAIFDHDAQRGLFNSEVGVHLFGVVLGVRGRVRVRSRRRHGRRLGASARLGFRRSATVHRRVVRNEAVQQIALLHHVGGGESDAVLRGKTADVFVHIRQLVVHLKVGIGDVAGVLNRNLIPDHVVQLVGVLLRVSSSIVVHHAQRDLLLLQLGFHRHGKHRVGRLEFCVFARELRRHRVHEFAPEDIRLGDRVGRGGRNGLARLHVFEHALRQRHALDLLDGDRLDRIVDVLHRDGEGHHFADVVSAIFVRLGHDQTRSNILIQNRQQTREQRDCVVRGHVLRATGDGHLVALDLRVIDANQGLVVRVVRTIDHVQRLAMAGHQTAVRGRFGYLILQSFAVCYRLRGSVVRVARAVDRDRHRSRIDRQLAVVRFDHDVLFGLIHRANRLLCKRRRILVGVSGDVGTLSAHRDVFEVGLLRYSVAIYSEAAHALLRAIVDHILAVCRQLYVLVIVEVDDVAYHLDRDRLRIRRYRSVAVNGDRFLFRRGRTKGLVLNRLGFKRSLPVSVPVVVHRVAQIRPLRVVEVDDVAFHVDRELLARRRYLVVARNVNRGLGHFCSERLAVHGLRRRQHLTAVLLQIVHRVAQIRPLDVVHLDDVVRCHCADRQRQTHRLVKLVARDVLVRVRVDLRLILCAQVLRLAGVDLTVVVVLDRVAVRPLRVDYIYNGDICILVDGRGNSTLLHAGQVAGSGLHIVQLACGGAGFEGDRGRRAGVDVARLSQGFTINAILIVLHLVHGRNRHRRGGGERMRRSTDGHGSLYIYRVYADIREFRLRLGIGTILLSAIRQSAQLNHAVELCLEIIAQRSREGKVNILYRMRIAIVSTFHILSRDVRPNGVQRLLFIIRPVVDIFLAAIDDLCIIAGLCLVKPGQEHITILARLPAGYSEFFSPVVALRLINILRSAALTVRTILRPARRVDRRTGEDEVVAHAAQLGRVGHSNRGVLGHCEARIIDRRRPEVLRTGFGNGDGGADGDGDLVFYIGKFLFFGVPGRRRAAGGRRCDALLDVRPGQREGVAVGQLRRIRNRFFNGEFAVSALPDGVKDICAAIVQAHFVARSESRPFTIRRRVPLNELIAGILASEAESVISCDLHFGIDHLQIRVLDLIRSVIAMILDYNLAFDRRIVRHQHDVGRCNRYFLAGIIAVARCIRPVGKDHALGRSEAALRRLGFGIDAIAVRIHDIITRASAGSVGNSVDVALKYRTDGNIAVEGGVDVNNLAISIHPAQKLLAALLNEGERFFILIAARNGAALGHFRRERLRLRVHGYRYRNINRLFLPIGVENQVLRRHGLAREVVRLRIVRNVLRRHEIPALERRILIAGRTIRFATLVRNRGLVANLLARLIAVVILRQGVGYAVVIEVGFIIKI